jgi:hypothetical protein
MRPQDLIRFKCPSGHTLKAPAEYAGRQASCPACDKRIQIPQTAVTESGVARMLDLMNDESAVRQRATPPVAEPAASAIRLAPAPQRQCGKCHKLIDKSASICMHCQTVQFPSNSSARALFEAATRHILRR